MESLVKKIKSGYLISKDEAMKLIDYDLDSLKFYANSIREHFLSNKFNVCGIVNGKNGNCSEDCKFCAQSIHSDVSVESYGLRDTDSLLKEITYNANDGIMRTSIVTSGRKLSKSELLQITKSYRKIKDSTDVFLCGSHGLLEYEDFVELKNSGVSRYHCNLESSNKFFPQICSTHNYEDRINTIKKAQKAGLEICSGGIIGMGETMEDRIDMALELQSLEVKSIPINILSPIKGTALEDKKPLSYEEIQRVFAIFRFINPKAFIRYAAGRGNVSDLGEECFSSGANAIISGNLLNTKGINVKRDMNLIDRLGFELYI